jgi:mRNA-degrading endonuclease RelE of RelBE toxin-antitoxin system
MANVVLTPAAQEQMNRLPGGMLRRINDILFRLEKWPEVSGAKPMRKELVGNFRIRSGAWRVVFRVKGETVIVWQIDNRRDVYDD